MSTDALTIAEQVMTRVLAERNRQDALKRSGKFPWTCAAYEVPEEMKLAVLIEEVGEVSRAVQNGWTGSSNNLQEELEHVCAVAFAWLESLEAGGT